MGDGLCLRRMTSALAWRPEWPAVVLAAAAWVALMLAPPFGHRGHEVLATSPAGLPPALSVLGTWTLMCVAMMAPATLPAVRHVGLNSIRARRRWAMTLYLGAYLAVWVAFGAAALSLVAVAAAWGAASAALVLAGLGLAAWWQTTRWKRRALVACRRTVPLPPAGWRADLGCARFGVSQASRCVVSSWPLMLLMAVIGHGSALSMATLTGYVVAEERGLLRCGRTAQAAFLLVIAIAGTALLLGTR